VFAEPLGLTIMLAIKPLVWYVLFGSLFGQIADLPQFPVSDYQSYILPGIIVMLGLEYMTIAGSCVVEDLQEGFLQKMWAAPIDKSSVVFGRVIVMALLNGLQMVALFIIAFAAGLTIETGIAGLLVIFLMASLMVGTMSSLSILIAYTVKQEFSFGVIASFFVLPVLFVSNAFMPTSLMPDWLGTLAELNPISIVTDGMRTLIIDGWVMDSLLPTMTLLVVSLVVSMAVTSFALSRAIERS
jgi:ABC-2 type transport system permease protein